MNGWPNSPAGLLPAGMSIFATPFSFHKISSSITAPPLADYVCNMNTERTTPFTMLHTKKPTSYSLLVLDLLTMWLMTCAQRLRGDLLRPHRPHTTAPTAHSQGAKQRISLHHNLCKEKTGCTHNEKHLREHLHLKCLLVHDLLTAFKSQ